MQGLVVKPFAATKNRLRNAHCRHAASLTLDSAGGPTELARYSLFAVEPRAVFQVTDDSWSLVGELPWAGLSREMSAPQALDALLAATQLTEPAQALDACTGWYGYVGYEAAGLFERLVHSKPRSSSMPDIWLAYCDAIVAFDEWTQRSYCIGRALDGDVAAARRRVDQRVVAISRLDDSEPCDQGCPFIARDLTADLTAEEYRVAVARAIEYIRAGDIFQVNLSQGFQAPFVGDVAALYSRLMATTKAPFAALLRAADWTVLSTSPELFVRASPHGRIETRPIKGTRPRGSDPKTDAELARELLVSPKDQAELAMIVDLERNDLGRICEYGSVRVERHAALESYSNVHHLVSTVTGQLRPAALRNRSEILRALFPGGSITGAPKIRAMQIIDELEPCRRGVYTGAIGYFADDGRAQFNVAIRTAVVESGSIHYRVGGGIVADSQPEAEYQETLAKGAALRQAIDPRAHR